MSIPRSEHFGVGQWDMTDNPLRSNPSRSLSCVRPQTRGTCGKPVPEDAPLPMCMPHLAQAWEYCGSAVHRARYDRWDDPDELVVRSAEFAQLSAQAIAEREAMLAELAADAEIDDLDSVVYYLKFADRIKIGFSRNLGQRLIAIPHDELLTVEPGARMVEARRHKQFAEHRIIGEWFAMAPALLEHVAQLQAKQADRNRWKTPAQRAFVRLLQEEDDAEVLASLKN